MRDYVDLHALTGKHTVPFATMRAALRATSRYRGVTIRPLSEAAGEFATLRQNAYTAFRRRLGPDNHHLPAHLSDVVADVIRFVDPLTDPEKSTTTWNSALREWQ